VRKHRRLNPQSHLSLKTPPNHLQKVGSGDLAENQEAVKEIGTIQKLEKACTLTWAMRSLRALTGTIKLQTAKGTIFGQTVA
jgi:hypothetical protein